MASRSRPYIKFSAKPENVCKQFPVYHNIYINESYMIMLDRYLEHVIRKDIVDKMVFVDGPRQVGKTTLAKEIGKKYFSARHLYLNWDNREDRKAILGSVFAADKELFIFDEIHKYSKWKNYLKGEFDQHAPEKKIIVTGSARLDMFRKGGDSLLGRYFHYRLHPLSLAEIIHGSDNLKLPQPFGELRFPDLTPEADEGIIALLRFGGFPEMFVKQSERALRRWHNDRVDRLVSEDIRDLERLRDFSALQVLIELLPSRAGSLFSLNSLREDLQVTHGTVAAWVDILERFYYHFRIHPYQANLVKSLRKAPKLFLWDWSELTDPGARFENLVASHLLKFCHFMRDHNGYRTSLHFLRDTGQREVDFLVAVDGKPWFCVETKKSFQRKIPNPLQYFRQKLGVPFAYMVVEEKGVDLIKQGVRIISAARFLAALI